MEWIALIGLLLQIFGPLIKQLLEKWLAKRLEMAAAAMPHPSTYASEGEARDALFDVTIATTWNPLKRFLLKRLKRHAATMGVGFSGAVPPIPPEVAAELQEFAEVMGDDD